MAANFLRKKRSDSGAKPRHAVASRARSETTEGIDDGESLGPTTTEGDLPPVDRRLGPPSARGGLLPAERGHAAAAGACREKPAGDIEGATHQEVCPPGQQSPFEPRPPSGTPTGDKPKVSRPMLSTRVLVSGRAYRSPAMMLGQGGAAGDGDMAQAQSDGSRGDKPYKDPAMFGSAPLRTEGLSSAKFVTELRPSDMAMVSKLSVKSEGDLPPLTTEKEPKAPEQPKLISGRGLASKLLASCAQQRPVTPVCPAIVDGQGSGSGTPSRPTSRHSHRHSSGQSSQQEWLQAEACVVIDMAEQCRWHVVDATAGRDPNVVPGELAPPGRPSAVLVLADLPSLQTACQAISRVRENLRSMQESSASSALARSPLPPPVIAVLPSNSSSAGFEVASVKAQKELLCCGADDVIVKSGIECDLRLAVLMATVRAEAKHELRDNYKRELRRQVQLALGEDDPRSGLFWQAVQMIFAEFPPMNKELASDPGEGDEVGPICVGGKLGQGGFGQVFSATSLETGEIEAVKMIDKSTIQTLQGVSDLWREIKVLRRINHVNLVKFHGCIHGPTHLYIRMEMAGKRNLYHVVKKHPSGMATETARQYQSQMASAIAHLHARGIAHRDLKPENVAVSQDGTLVKILDFGSVAPMDRDCCDMAGTMPFMAPEVLAGGDEEPYDPSGCDVWSTAVLLLEMLCGPDKFGRMLHWGRKHMPCPDRCDELEAFFAKPDALTKALEADLGPLEDSLSVLVSGMLQLDLSQRWSAKQVTKSAWCRPSESGS